MAVHQDPIADMLTRIRNGQHAQHAKVVIPGSKLKLAVAKILSQYGYIGDVSWSDEGHQGEVHVGLRYDDNGVGLIRKIQRVSKPSRRQYVSASEIPPVLNGLGLAVLSTSRGVISDREARAENVGGELLCTVY